MFHSLSVVLLDIVNDCPGWVGTEEKLSYSMLVLVVVDIAEVDGGADFVFDGCVGRGRDY